MSSTSHQEQEAKFVVQSAALGDTLRSAPTLYKEYALTPATTVTQLDLYIDTPDYSLLRTGYALRLRQTPGGYMATLKSLNTGDKSALHRRLEVEEPVEAAADLSVWKAWPQTVRAILPNKVPGGQKMVPTCAICQTRHKRMVTWTKAGETAGQPFAELSLDEVQVLRIDRLAQSDIWAMAWQELPVESIWCEVEVELLPGQDEALLAALSTSLSKRRGLRPAAASKFERALGLAHSSIIVAGESIDQLRPQLTMGDGCRLIWRQQLAQLLLNEAGVRADDDIEYVHAMRVAVRRIRTALRFFGRFFRPKIIRPFRRALQTTGRLLGTVRDRDVALARLAKHGRQVENGQPNAFESFGKEWREEREQAFRELIAWLDSDDYRRFISRFARFCAQSGKGLRRVDRKDAGAQRPHQVRHVLPVVIIKRYSQVRAFESLFGAGQSLSPQMLHELRIQCKFLRYILEFAQPLLGAGAARFITLLKELQDQLGTLNDAVVSQSLLAEKGTPEATAAAESYHASQQVVIDQLQLDVAAALADLFSPATRRLVTQAVMRL